jgi:hypothetical protein
LDETQEKYLRADAAPSFGKFSDQQNFPALFMEEAEGSTMGGEK